MKKESPTSFQLNEAAEHLQNLIQEVDQGEYDEDGDIAFAVTLSHVVNHLLCAFNSRDMSWDDFSKASQEAYEEGAYTIPWQFGPSFKLENTDAPQP